VGKPRLICDAEILRLSDPFHRSIDKV
jgi:hypothetical protein